MAFAKKTYTEGQTVITAQNLNDIQDEIVSIDTTLPTMQSNITGLRNTCWVASKTTAAQYQTTTTVCSLTIPADSQQRIYLALGFCDMSAGNSGIMNCNLNGSDMTIVQNTCARTVGTSGGGCMTYMIFRNNIGTAPTVNITAYGYTNATYNFNGKLTVIRLS